MVVHNGNYKYENYITYLKEAIIQNILQLFWGFHKYTKDTVIVFQIYEDSLINVKSALERGKQLSCVGP